VATELLAQAVEMLSITAADRRIGEPIRIPGRGCAPPPAPPPHDGTQPRNPFTAAIQRMMATPAPGAAA
jgi:hypothetical protein